MTMLEFNLLGGAEIMRNGRPLTGLGLRKARALLYYVVTTERMHSRIALAGLLWGELPEANARRNLRKALTRLRKFSEDCLFITRQSVAMRPEVDYQVDVARFRKLTGPGSGIDDRRAAIARYQGDFLDGFFVRNAPEFEQWMLGQRALLHDRAVTCLQQSAAHLARERDDEKAISYAKRLLALEPWSEETHRLLMTLYARSGQVASAVAQYETCRQVLADELGIEPAGETQELLVEIRQRIVRAPPSAAAAPSNLPQTATAFIGREGELDELMATVLKPSVRLLTLVGLGGVGKTRLALALASRLQDDKFRDGRYFCSLEALHFSDATDEETVRATVGVNVLSSMNVPLSPGGDPFRQLSDHLRQRRLLLILDNFESLLRPGLAPVAAKLVQELLAHSAPVTLLLTSRQPLHLRAEWLYDIDGLPLPQAGEGEARKTASVRLFNETARRQDRHFDYDAQRSAVHQICRLVGGLPLAIELAAGLVREKVPAEIASQIEESLEGISAKWHDLPLRQRSLNATFEYTWQLLTKPERQLLAMLAYTQRGSSHDAARTVVGGLIHLLDNLAAKSLVRIQAERIYLHEVVLQFARQKLGHVPEWQRLVSERHGRYFLRQLERVEGGLERGDDYHIGLALRPDLENNRTAWRWAIAEGEFGLLNRAARGLMLFFHSMGWLSEGMSLLEGAVRALQPERWETLPTLINCLLQQGLLAVSKEDTARAGELADLSAGYLDRMAGQESSPDLLLLQGQQHYLQGYIAHADADWSVARTHLAKAATTFRRLNRRYEEARAYFVIGNGWMGERQWRKVVETGETVLSLARESGNPRLEAKTLATMAVAYTSVKELEAAKAHREQARALAAHIKWPVRDEIVWLGLAAEQALDAGYLNEAASHIEQIAPLVVRSGSLFYEDWNHVQHGHLLRQIGEYEKAIGHYARARDCATAVEKPTMIAFALICLCAASYRWQKAERLAKYAQALAEVAAQLDGDYYRARAASWTGMAALANNRPAEAEPSLLEALAETTDGVCLCEARWGVMNCYRRLGKQEAAYETAVTLTESPLFANLPMMVTELLLPFQIYHDAWRALRPVGLRQAEKVREIAGDHLRERLPRIENQEWRDAYLLEKEKPGFLEKPGQETRKNGSLAKNTA